MTIFKRTLIFILLLTFMAPLAGCSPKPEATVAGFFDAMKKLDTAKASTFLKGEGTKEEFKFENAEQEKMIKAILSKSKYEVVSSNVSGKNATIKAKVTSVDAPKIFGKTISDTLGALIVAAFSKDNSKDDIEKQLMTSLTNGLNDPNAPLTTTEVDIKLEKGSKGWLIVPSEDLTNAMTGNFGKAFDSLQKADVNAK